MAEAFIRNVDLIRRQHVVLVNMLQPPGVAPLFSSPNVASVDDLYQHLGGHLQWHSLRELEKEAESEYQAMLNDLTDPADRAVFDARGQGSPGP